MSNQDHYKPSIVAHYQREMALAEIAGTSKSPTKPRRFMEFLMEKTPIGRRFVTQRLVESSKPRLDELADAHELGYIRSFMEGRSIDGFSPTSNGLPWSAPLVDQALLNVASICQAAEAAIQHPAELQLSPTSGFHHAGPTGGQGFCTFSGQVIAAVREYRRSKSTCAWIDLDGHFGNSIEDTRAFCPPLAQAIPLGNNINPWGQHEDYLRDLTDDMQGLGGRVIAGKINYVCVALGADSHEWDPVGGGQLSTDEWIAAVDIVFSNIRHWSNELGRPVPVVLSLFGGYRDDHPESVLGLHAMGVARALYWLAGQKDLVDFRCEVRKPVGFR